MATKIIVEVEGEDSKPKDTVSEAARILAVSFHTTVRARLWTSTEAPDGLSGRDTLGDWYRFGSNGNPVKEDKPEDV